MPRKYTHIKKFEAELIVMIENGATLREAGAKYGFTKDEMKGFKKRYNASQRKKAYGIEPLKRGRPRKGDKDTEERKIEYYKRELRLAKYKNDRLRMENELLRDFLLLTERK